MKRSRNAAVAGVVGTALALAVVAVDPAGAHTRTARTTLRTADGSRLGSVEFRTHRDHTAVTVRLGGLVDADGFHGFHIHWNNDPANGEGCIADPAALSSTWFVSADGHYNPDSTAHAHHAGDMPVVHVNEDGTVSTTFEIDRIAPGELKNKVVILHAGPDNYANVPVGTGAKEYAANTAEATDATAKTGNAGDRLACGVITSR